MRTNSHQTHGIFGWVGIMRREYRFTVLLITLLLLLLSSPMVYMLERGTQSKIPTMIFSGFFLITMLSAVFAASDNERMTTLSLSLAIPTIISQVIDVFYEWVGIEVVNNLLEILFLSYTIIVILGFIFRNQRVTFDVIPASLCVYLLLAIVWSIIYSLIETLQPGSFIFAYADKSEALSMQFGSAESIFAIYYSLVTITTLGYGDLAPVSPLARIFAVMEAVIGQIYLTVLVARLVGVNASQLAHKESAGR